MLSALATAVLFGWLYQSWWWDVGLVQLPGGLSVAPVPPIALAAIVALAMVVLGRGGVGVGIRAALFMFALACLVQIAQTQFDRPLRAALLSGGANAGTALLNMLWDAVTCGSVMTAARAARPGLISGRRWLLALAAGALLPLTLAQLEPSLYLGPDAELAEFTIAQASQLVAVALLGWWLRVGSARTITPAERGRAPQAAPAAARKPGTARPGGARIALALSLPVAALISQAALGNLSLMPASLAGIRLPPIAPGILALLFTVAMSGIGRIRILRALVAGAALYAALALAIVAFAWVDDAVYMHFSLNYDMRITRVIYALLATIAVMLVLSLAAPGFASRLRWVVALLVWPLFTLAEDHLHAPIDAATGRSIGDFLLYYSAAIVALPFAGIWLAASAPRAGDVAAPAAAARAERAGPRAVSPLAPLFVMPALTAGSYAALFAFGILSFRFPVAPLGIMLAPASVAAFCALVALTANWLGGLETGAALRLGVRLLVPLIALLVAQTLANQALFGAVPRYQLQSVLAFATALWNVVSAAITMTVVGRACHGFASRSRWLTALVAWPLLAYGLVNGRFMLQQMLGLNAEAGIVAVLTLRQMIIVGCIGWWLRNRR